eukprot:CAMPEP_0172532568 /NCGR_PEP_ID=MMETSP1067-20121228/5571_1 /TAXON_ID=265564 ORGANISM="Thalassiosira punctigera, Strain Tpunct2005C2" /NCGR_SAMPLE_ID=MMETSP1067 /ASSEMBLY_ACC=CAM_ASM_000444 /LENGTH=197 /DNA_ID=CAMNT_0013317097 /DNA_START=289 /DNA_END=882 /DNA_ORIENTATION=-
MTESVQGFSPIATLDFYANALIQKPLLTKSLTSCGTNAFSDVLCQKLKIGSNGMQEGVKIDSERIRHAAATGMIWSGPVTHAWYSLLFGKLTVSIKDPVTRLIVNIILDAIIFSPIAVSGYFAMRSILEGAGFAGLKEKLSTKLFSTVVGAWKFWPAANVINFSIVPIPFRVLYMNVASIIWTGYLTYVNSKKVTTN